MSTLAVVDIGSNSIKVSVLDRQNGREVLRASESVRLFSSAGGKSSLTAEVLEAGAQAVARLVAIAREQKADPIVLLGTSALRECDNRGDFDARLRALTGLSLTLVSGEVEARLAADGVRSDPALASYQHIFAFDLGGGSLEVMEIRGQRCTLARSFPLGSVRLTQTLLGGASGPISESAQSAFRADVLQSLGEVIPPQVAERALIVGAGGAFAVIALYLEALGESPVGGRLPLLRIRELKDKLCRMTADERRTLPGIPADRLDIMPAALLTLCILADLTGAEAFQLTHRGVRHGMVQLLMGESGKLFA
jgi:exopolyphosphatase/guanosine-5'-triphosphate,3'-diphosphate pyrophosphatase